MTITLNYKLKNELTKKQIVRLNQLHLKRGLMWGYFLEQNDCSIILAQNKNLIVAWGLIYFNEDSECYEFHVYVSKKCRRMGIGTKIFELASDIFPDGLWVSRWSEEAEAFFSQFEMIQDFSEWEAERDEHA